MSEDFNNLEEENDVQEDASSDTPSEIFKKVTKEPSP